MTKNTNKTMMVVAKRIVVVAAAMAISAFSCVPVFATFAGLDRSARLEDENGNLVTVDEYHFDMGYEYIDDIEGYGYWEDDVFYPCQCFLCESDMGDDEDSEEYEDDEAYEDDEEYVDLDELGEDADDTEDANREAAEETVTTPEDNGTETPDYDETNEQTDEEPGSQNDEWSDNQNETEVPAFPGTNNGTFDFEDKDMNSDAQTTPAAQETNNVLPKTEVEQIVQVGIQRRYPEVVRTAEDNPDQIGRCDDTVSENKVIRTSDASGTITKSPETGDSIDFGALMALIATVLISGGAGGFFLIRRMRGF